MRKTPAQFIQRPHGTWSICLVLLRSRPDTVHSVALRETRFRVTDVFLKKDDFFVRFILK